MRAAMKNLILVVGSLNMDFVVSVDELPPPGATVPGHSFQMIPGGKGANQACAAAKLAADRMPVSMIGRVGKDVFGERLRASLSEAGAGSAAVYGTAAPTGVALIIVARGGLNQIVVAPGANGELAPADLEAAQPLFEVARLVLFQLETPLETVATGLAMARHFGAETMLDPAPARPLPPGILSEVDILTPNETEALALAGASGGGCLPDEDVKALAAGLCARGPRSVVLKLGERGAYAMAGDVRQLFPAPGVSAVDSTAAGDTFNAALAVALAEGHALADAIPFANAAAALSVTRYGAQASIPSRGEVDEFLKTGKQPVRNA